ncbi:MAG: hypothetical protein ACYS8X_05820 [Planctomycetota bacterium]|jgi:hypothetical protein
MNVRILSLIALAVLVTGCEKQSFPGYHNSNQVGGVDPWAVESANDQAIQNAIVRQSTLFPYHFVEDSAELNYLGTRDMASLIRHYQEHPGRLNMRQGYVSRKLYHSRIAFVKGALQSHGINAKRLRVTDLPAAGDGMPGELVIEILTQEAPAVTPSTSASSLLSGA